MALFHKCKKNLKPSKIKVIYDIYDIKMYDLLNGYMKNVSKGLTGASDMAQIIKVFC